jgi:hypothetical protein
MVSLPLPFQFPIPPARLTQLEALPGNPYTGPGFFTLTRPRGPIPTDAYGIAWQAFPPIGYGTRVWTVTTFEEPVAQLLVVKKDLLGVTLNGQVVDIDQDEGRLMFDESLNVEQVTLYVIAAAHVNLSWVLVF